MWPCCQSTQAPLNPALAPCHIRDFSSGYVWRKCNEVLTSLQQTEKIDVMILVTFKVTNQYSIFAPCLGPQLMIF